MKRLLLFCLAMSCVAPPAKNLAVASVETPAPSPPAALPAAQPTQRYALIDIWGSGPNDIYILADSDVQALFHSLDHGESWQKRDLPRGINARSIWGSSASELHMEGTNREDGSALAALSIDQGETWRDTPPTSHDEIRFLSTFYNSNPKDWPLAYAGEPWTQRINLTSDDTEDLILDFAWGDGSGSILLFSAWSQYKSNNGGRSWLALNPAPLRPEASPLADFDFSLRGIWGSSLSDIYLLGDLGQISHTTDQGRSWQHTKTEHSFRSIWGSGPDDVYVVGGDETILHSKDSGNSWQRLPLTSTTKDASQAQRGVSLGIYYEKPGRTYEPMIDEIAALGADHIELLVHLWQKEPSANTIYQWPKLTISDKRLAEVIRYAKKKNLNVFLYPLLNIAGHGGWRGAIAPADWDVWWSSYQKMILHYADIAQTNGVELFSIGSEMSSAESMHDRWVTLIQETKKVFSGKIVYAANWDRYASLSFEDELDYVGIDAYFPLTDKREPSYEELVASWKKYRGEILSWQKRSGRNFLFTELGYRSRDGSNQSPWDYGAGGQVDLDEQLLCYRAFREVWRSEPAMQGVYIWSWSRGGKDDRGYSPKGKPAEAEIKDWFSSARQ